MALSYEQFMAASGAELCAGNLIVGIMGERRKVGTLSDDGVFNLNDEGKELAEDLEATPAERATRRKKAETVAEGSDKIEAPTE